MKSLLAAALAALLAAPCHAGCEDAARALFGVSLAPAAAALDRLAPGLQPGTRVESIPGTGLLALRGHADILAVDRLTVADDGGRFYEIRARVALPGEADHGLATIVQQLSDITDATPAQDIMRTTFACAAPYELSVEPDVADNGAHVIIAIANAQARAVARQRVADYCADPAHHDGTNACGKH